MVVCEPHSEFLHSSCPRESPCYKARQSGPLLKPTGTPQHFTTHDTHTVTMRLTKCDWAALLPPPDTSTIVINLCGDVLSAIRYMKWQQSGMSKGPANPKAARLPMLTHVHLQK